MLEPWATKAAERNFSLACQKAHKKYKCNTCHSCPYNIRWLHTPGTEQRELVFKHITYRSERNKHTVGNSLIVVALVALLLLFGAVLSYAATYNDVRRMVASMIVSDVNNDGTINCVDYSVCLYQMNPRLFDLVYLLMPDGTGHLAVLFYHETEGATLIDPQNNDINFVSFWKFKPSVVWIVTDQWYGGRLNKPYRREGYEVYVR